MRSCRECKISEIGKIVSGATPKTSIPEHYGGNIAWITPADLSGYQEKYISRGARNITQAGYDSCSAQLMPAGTVLFSSRAPIGYVAIAQNPICTNQGFKSIVPNDSVDSEFLYYQLKYLRKQIQEMGSGTTFKEISAKTLGEVRIVVPSISEQKRIVARIEELFSELDNGVETLRKTKQQLAVYRQAVLKESFNTESATTVEVSEIVDDIRIGPFGTMLHKSDYMAGGIPVINPQHIKNNTIIAGVNVTVSTQKAEELNAYKLKNNDIIMGRRGEMGRCAAVTQAEDGWLCGTGSILFRLKPEFDAGFYAQILSSPVVVHYLEENATGTTMKNLNEEIVRHIPIPYITREQQIAISKKIDAALSICDNIEKTVVSSLQQAETMRQSILKDAFEGRI